MKTPYGWSKSKLHYVAHVQTGLSKSDNRSGPSVKRPYLRVANVQDGYLDLTELKEIDVPLSQVDRYRLHKYDVLLTEGGDFDKLGRGCIWRNEVPNCVHQNHIFAVRVTKPEQLLPEFLACQIQSIHAKNYFLSCAKQTTNLASINSSQIKELPILLPPLGEQQEIVRVISIWDTAIETTDRLIAAKERHYAHELSRLISRGQHPCTHVGTDACDIFEGNACRTVTLAEIATVWKGQQLNRDAMVEDGPYYALNGGTMPSGRTTAWNCEAHTITISEGANSCGFVSYNSERFWCGGHCYALKEVSELVDVHYLFHYLKGKQERIMALRVGSGLPNIQKSDIETFPVILPDLTTQTAIACYLNALREEIDLFGKSLDALKRQKRGLMQKLLTGQWRVPSTDANAHDLSMEEPHP